MKQPDTGRFTRRTALKATAAGGILAPWLAAIRSHAEAPAAAHVEAIAAYMESLARPDGGYGWSDQPDSHLTPTFAVIGAYQALGRPVPRPDAAAAFVITRHPIRGKHAETQGHAAELRTFIFEQIQALLWLGKDANSLRAEVAKWTKPSTYPAYYEKAGRPILRQETMALVCRRLLAMPMADVSAELIDYLASRRRATGSFNNTPASDGSDGHVMNTLWGLQAMDALGRGGELRDAAVAWLRSCQLPGGGFTWQPKPPFAGIDDIAYTWAAVRALALLGSAPADREACIRYLWSLWNEDGGFGDRPGLPSDPAATWRALDALAALGALRDPAPAPKMRPAPRPAPLPDGLRVFTAQIEAPGSGSPSAAVDLARALGIHLWGAKNADPAWPVRAGEIARQRGVGVTFFTANEEYGTYINIPGIGVYSHMADVMAPAGAAIGPSLSGKDTDWPGFRRDRIEPLERAAGRMVWQICDNEEAARLLLDDSAERGGYAAISTFHFGCWNMAYTLPFVLSYRGRIPLVSLQDAHGSEPWWWADNLAGFRTLFLAAEPTWDGWLRALKERWVVAVRHDAVTQFRTRMMGGGPGVREFVISREAEWKWWGDRPDDIRRPGLSVAAVAPDDRFEAARPAEGVAICIRTRWVCGNLANPRQPVVELEGLTVDGRPAETRLVEKKDAKGILTDRYHVFAMAAPSPGRHTAVAEGRNVTTRERCTETVEFTVR